MKTIDEKGKLFGLINIIDLLILLFGALVIVAVVMFFSTNSTMNTAAKQTKITIEVIAVEKDLCDVMRPHKNIFDRIQNKSLGKLIDVKIEPSEEYNISTETGEHVKSTVPGRYDAILTIEAESPEDLYVGKRMSVETKDFMAAGYIVDIEKEGK